LNARSRPAGPRRWRGADEVAYRARRQLAAADAAHGWLNDIVAIGEGSIDPDRGLLAMRYYACTADYLPGIEPPAGQ